MMEIGAHESRGDLTVEHWCLQDDYREFGPSSVESARRTSETVRTAAAERLRLARLSGFSRDTGIPVPLVYTDEPVEVEW